MTYLIGLLIGGLLGLTGAGGSIFAVPLLIVLLGLPTPEAMGTALGAVALSAAYGVLHQRRRVLWLPGGVLAAAGMLTAPLGKWLAIGLPERWLLGGFSLLAITIALRMWRQAVTDPAAAAVTRGAALADPAESGNMPCRYSSDGLFHIHPRCLWSLILGGLAIGFMSGLFGVGGGFLIVPFLLFVSAVPMQTVVATSLFAIALVSGSGFISHLLLADELNSALLFKIIASGVAGMVLSQGIGAYLAGPRLQQIFAAALVAVSVFTLVWKF